MGLINDIKEIAKKKAKKLVLPEGTERRTVKAAAEIVKEKIASQVFLLGDASEIETIAKEEAVDLSAVTVINPKDSSKIDDYAKEYYELRKHKGMTEEQAKAEITEPLKWGAMMVRLSDADAMVAGAENTTGAVLKASFTIIKTKPGIKSASSCFVMIVDDKQWGYEGKMIFSDCATIPEPNVEQLAEIALAASESCRTFLGVEPKVAMLSFSTKGSAKTEATEKVVEATKLVQEWNPELKIDGELQLDAAIVPSVGEKKAPGSKIAGKANTLIFPDLAAGNIGYKLVQRLAGAEAIGPILQGFAKPVSDLSRGCSIEDIINVSALTISQCE